MHLCELPASYSFWTSANFFDGEYYVYHGGNARGPEQGVGGSPQDQPPDNDSNSVLSPPSHPQQPSWATMDGPTYACDYLGYNTLSKPATGIQMLQQPIKELYLKFRKHLSTGGGPRRASFKVTPAGLLVAVADGKERSEMFFDLSSINFLEAVRFSVLGSEKKPKAIFVPIDESRGPVSDKTAFSLDKNFHFLIKAGHHPLLVCVLRRPKGVKMLDCHVFALDTPENAVYIASLVQRLQQSGGSSKDFPVGAEPRQDGGFNRGVKGDVIRTEFGDYSVYRGGTGGPQPFELRDEHFRGAAGDGNGGGNGGGIPPQMDYPGNRGGHPNPRETYPAENADRPRYGWSYDKPQSGEDYKRVSGQYMGDGRPMSGGQIPDSPTPIGGDSRQFPRGDVRPGGQFPGDGRSAGDFPGGAERQPARGGSLYDHLGGPYRRQEIERSEVAHVRERSGDSTDSRPSFDRSSVSGSERMGGVRPYDDFGPSGRGGFGESRGSQRSEMPPRVMDKPVSPVMRHQPNGQQYMPGGSPIPAPAFSLSNRESRGDVPDDPQGNKPVAKVPPHLKGVKVLPSNFLDVKLKPKPKQSEETEGGGYDNQKNIMVQYKQLQEMEAQGNKGFGDPEVEKRSYNNNWNDDLKSGGGDVMYRRHPGDPATAATLKSTRLVGETKYGRRGYDPRYDEGSGGQAGGKYRHSSPTYGDRFGPSDNSAPAQAPGAPPGNWRATSAYEMGQGGFQRGGPQHGQGGGQLPYDMGQNYDRGYQQQQQQQQGYGRGMVAPGNAPNEEGLQGRKKDAEIANMFRISGCRGEKTLIQRTEATLSRVWVTSPECLLGTISVETVYVCGWSPSFPCVKSV
ncbi:hypothetical protein C0Q70_06886 [Pomacea canaliculata]|uniref:PID domain-containing protein n=1 Tax=Pomacea canaliculata TaxID=400727 RepID=A0A2T7PDH5_POMCA|nr:hypothetical protein C0Q70_06886 [Pomacea canaliculata]